jgi:adrenodoxin-NADP+ reductase
VGWYNGHPDVQFTPDLSGTHAVVFGHGNVALDVARMLLAPLSVLEKTDIADRALEALAASHIRHVTLVGRRGPLEVAFTIKELRELSRLPNVAPDVCLKDFDFSPEEAAYAQATRPRKRLVQLMRSLAEKREEEEGTPAKMARVWRLLFCHQPTEILDTADTGAVGAVDVQRAVLKGELGARRSIVQTGDDARTRLPAHLVIRSVGYKGVSLDDSLPFDVKRGTLAHTHSRVNGMPGLYASGWIKHGPVGVIASTMMDAQVTADMVLQDLDTLSVPARASEDFEQLLREEAMEVSGPREGSGFWAVFPRS